MATINLGRVAYVNRGAYDSAMTYEKHDVVTYNNGSYVFIGSMSAAGKEPTDSGYWMPMLDPTSVNEATDRANAAAEAAEEATANIQNEVNSKAVAISETASGDVVHITNCGAAPVQSLVTHIEPVQSGTGDPSPDNVRLISGWDSVTAQRVRKNVADTSPGRVHSGYYTDNEGVISANAKYVRVDAIPVMPGTTYTISSNLEIYSVWFGQGDRRTKRKGVSSGNKVTVTTEANGNRLYITLKNTSGAADITAFEWLQVELGSTVTAYEPYQGKTLTAELPETVYGGVLDWTTGVLTVDTAFYTFDGTEDWQAYNPEEKPYLFYLVNSNFRAKDGSTESKCSHFPYTSATSFAEVDAQRFQIINSNPNGPVDRLYVSSTSHLDVNSFKTYLVEQYAAGTPVTIVYTLSEPYTIQLTPQQLSTLKGVNNIWSDAGTTEVVYTLDTRTYIDRAEEKIQALSAVVAPSIFVDASGDIVTITDGAEGIPAQSLITHVEPIEIGTGEKGPNNPWTIIGRDEVKTQRTGKNLAAIADKSITSYGVTIAIEAGVITMNGTSTSTSSRTVLLWKSVLKPGTYTLSHNVLTGDMVGAPENGSVLMCGSQRTRLNAPATTITVEVEEEYSFNIVQATPATTYDNFSFSVQLEKGDTATDFEPPNVQTLTADLPETVYGGTVDWGTGVLTVDRMCELLLNNGEWHQSTTNPNYYTNNKYGKKMYYERGNKSTLICTHGVWMALNNTPEVGTPSGRVYGYIKSWIGMTSDYSTLDEFAAWLDAQEQAGTPVTVVYELAEPYTIQLTPQQLSTLKGTNNIWSDAGQTAVTYAADTKMYIDQKIAAIAAAIVN